MSSVFEDVILPLGAGPRVRYKYLISWYAQRVGWVYGWQAQVARELGVSRSYVNHIIKGTKNPGPKTIIKAVERHPCLGAMFADVVHSSVPPAVV